MQSFLSFFFESSKRVVLVETLLYTSVKQTSFQHVFLISLVLLISLAKKMALSSWEQQKRQ